MIDTMIGIDLAKNVFQLHGASLTGELKFRKKLSRPQFRKFMEGQPSSIVVFEACGGAHYWARELEPSTPINAIFAAVISFGCPVF